MSLFSLLVEFCNTHTKKKTFAKFSFREIFVRFSEINNFGYNGSMSEQIKKTITNVSAVLKMFFR